MEILTAFAKEIVMQIENFLENDIESDELGRVIIRDMRILEAINGAIANGLEFMVPDAACGNGNCVC